MSRPLKWGTYYVSGHEKFAIFTKKLVIKPQWQGQVTLIFADSHVIYPRVNR
jgi:hypothetical protein